MDYKTLIKNIKNFEEYKLIKSQIFSDKGPIFDLQQKIKNADSKEKAELGKQLSTLKYDINNLLDAKIQEIKLNEIKDKISNDKNNIYEYSNQFANFHPIFLISNRIRE